jgi:hypothetical protein
VTIAPGRGSHDRRAVVSLCVEGIGVSEGSDAKITSLPQLTRGAPATGAGAAGCGEHQQATAVAECEERGEGPLVQRPQPRTFRASTARAWLRQRETGRVKSDPMLSLLP